jgi:hypothetical protein
MKQRNSMSNVDEGIRSVLTYSSWIEEKSQLAHALAAGSCNGTYADGAIVLCTCISAMSSLMWVKKKGTDRSRFIEILARFPQPQFDPTIVSAPLLSQKHNPLREKLAVSDMAFRYTGSTDKSEADVIKLCPTDMSLTERRKLARRYSYACLLYEHIRCGFIHTYSTTDSATSGDALRDIFDRGVPNITYVNYLAAQGMRKIYFPLEWISEVAKSAATGLDHECQRLGKFLGENLDLAVPSMWWIDGA